jgi:hypothetical protein
MVIFRIYISSNEMGNTVRNIPSRRWGQVDVDLYFHPTLILGSGSRWVVNVMPWPLYSGERDPERTVEETRWASRSVFMSPHNLFPPGFDPRTMKRVSI